MAKSQTPSALEDAARYTDNEGYSVPDFSGYEVTPQNVDPSLDGAPSYNVVHVYTGVGVGVVPSLAAVERVIEEHQASIAGVADEDLSFTSVRADEVFGIADVEQIVEGVSDSRGGVSAGDSEPVSQDAPAEV